MSVECEDFISAAERILSSDNTEIAWRIAAGRAYYGAYHCVRNLVCRQPLIVVPENFGQHERYYQAIQSLPLTFAGAKELKNLAYRTQNLRGIRTLADYHLEKPFIKVQAEQAIRAARTVHSMHLQFIAEFKLP